MSYLPFLSLYSRKHSSKMIYLPIGPRFERFFGTSNLSEIVQSHLQSTTDDDCMYDIHDSPAWIEAY